MKRQAESDSNYCSGFQNFRKSMFKYHFAWDLEPYNSKQYEGGAVGYRYGNTIFTEAWFDPLAGFRSADKIDHGRENYIELIMFTEGGMHVSQSKRETYAGAGDFLLWDALQPGKFDSNDRTRANTILFPRYLANQYLPNIEDLYGRTISSKTTVGSLLSSYVVSLHRNIATANSHEYSGLVCATLEMLRAYTDSPDHLGNSKRQRFMLQSIINLIKEHYSNPDCSPESIADELSISERYLRKILADSNTTFSELLKSERLLAASKALTSISFNQESIVTIAYRFGFCDAAHFSKSFKSKFGCSPREYRNQALISFKNYHSLKNF